MAGGRWEARARRRPSHGGVTSFADERACGRGGGAGVAFVSSHPQRVHDGVPGSRSGAHHLPAGLLEHVAGRLLGGGFLGELCGALLDKLRGLGGLLLGGVAGVNGHLLGSLGLLAEEAERLVFALDGAVRDGLPRLGRLPHGVAPHLHGRLGSVRGRLRDGLAFLADEADGLVFRLDGAVLDGRPRLRSLVGLGVRLPPEPARHF